MRLIKEQRPGDGVLSEEGSDNAGSSGIRWVIDPLDGTVNYLFSYQLGGRGFVFDRPRRGGIAVGEARSIVD